MPESEAPALKEIFDAARFRHIAEELRAIDPSFDAKRFLKLALADLDSLSLMQRLRRMTESLHATLPQDYPKALAIRRQMVMAMLVPTSWLRMRPSPLRSSLT